MGYDSLRPPVVMVLIALALGVQAAAPVAGQEGFKFRSGVELINVTATVTDRSGRFLPGLTKEDFTVYEDNQPVEITHFSAERSPVSLGIVIDTSGSMAGEKWNAARDAIDRFLERLNDELDRLRSVTVEQIRAYAAERLGEDNRAVLAYLPKGGTT